MKRFISRLTKVILVVTIPFFILTLIELLTEITGGKIGDYLQKNYGISTTTMVISLLVLMLFSLAIQIWDKWNASNQRFDSANSINQQGIGNVAVQDVSGKVTINNYVSSERKPKSEGIEADLQILYDSLKERYKKRYESKLDGRFEITLEVNEDWRFDKPATYKFSAEAKVSEAVAAVRKAFDEKGRLLIVGNAGSGKTVLLLKLAIQLLGENYDKDKKIPVIFNLASWREDYKNFEDWLIEVLNTGNGLSKEFAKTVLREKRLVFLLDGLDELARNEENAHEIRAKCMDSLNDYLREGRRTVICCRREEFAAMQKTTAKDAPVSAKTEVLDLTKADIILALHQAKAHNESRAAAENLEKLIETNETVLEVLSTPFYFTTALEVFDKPNFNDNNLPTDSDKLRTYLLKNYVDNKIKFTAKLTEFEADTNKIKHWLIWLARLMEKKHLVNFELADLQPADLIKRWHYRFCFSLVIGLVGSLVFSFIGSLAGSLFGGIVGGLLYFSAGYFINSWNLILTEDNLSLDFSLKSLKMSLVIGLACGLFVGLICGLIVWLGSSLIVGLSNGLIVGSGGGLITGLVFGLYFGLEVLKKTKPISIIKSPYQRISSGTKINGLTNLFFTFTVFWTYFTFNTFASIYNLDNILGKVPSIYYFFILIPFFHILSMPLLRHIYLRLCLWFEGSMPLKYATFLDLAAEARILEKDGGQWRFRHQNLQEYFAELETGE